MTVAPRSLVHQLHRQWEAIAALCYVARKTPMFEATEVTRLLARYPLPDATPAEQLATLVRTGILERLGGDEVFQLNALVVEFVRGLTREHDLGLASVLKARVEAIRAATEALAGGIEARDMDALNRDTAALADLFRQIAQQLENDLHAILELAEEAKAERAEMPLTQRYRQVLEAYDKYVEPMNAMMDLGPEGIFHPCLAQAIAILERAHEHLVVHGELYSRRLQARRVTQQAKWLRERGRVVAKRCADTLLPLRDAARRHTRWSAAASRILGQVRKRGARQALSADALPGWQSGRRRHVHVDDRVRAVMAAALDYAPQARAFPEAPREFPQLAVARINEKELLARLARAMPVANLLTWLRGEYPALDDATLLRLYHELAARDDWQVVLAEEAETTRLTTLAVTYHPYALSTREAG